MITKSIYKTYSRKMAITTQGRSSTRNITISSDGTVTAIN